MAQNIRKITFYLFGLKFLGLFISLLVLSLSAKYFGISQDRDVWILVSSFLVAIGGAVFGPLNETFRAKFTHLKEIDTTRKSESMLASLFGFVIVVGIIISLVIGFFPNVIMEIVAPSLKESFIFYQMLLILIPSLLLNQLIYLGIGVLNINNIFYIPEIVGFLSGLINLACIYLLTPSIGIYSLVVSQYIYLVIYFFVVLFFIHKIGIKIVPNFFFKWVDIKPFIVFSLPFFLPYFFGQCNLILEKSLANILGEGIVSILDYSRRFSTILQTVLTSILASVMVSDLTKYFSKKQFDEYSKNHYKYLEIMVLILCLSLPILVGAADTISRIFFMKGNMTEYEVQRIAFLMQLFCAAFFCVSLYLFFGLTLMSQMKGKLYAILGVFAQILMMLVNVLFYKILRENAFPISLFISHLLAAVIMFKFIVIENKKQQVLIILKAMIFITLSIFIIYGENLLLKNRGYIFILSANLLTMFILTVWGLFPLIGINILEILKGWKRRI